MERQTDGINSVTVVMGIPDVIGVALRQSNTLFQLPTSFNFSAPATLYPLKHAVPQQESEMLMVMEMSTGRFIEDEFGAFEDEVLGAEWTPASPDLQLGLQEVQHRVATAQAVDADAFLSAMYLNQQ